MPKKSLFEVLRTKEDGSHLIDVLDTIKNKAAPYLSEIIKTFPEYTPHDITHSKNILKILDIIIPDSLKEKLDEYEIYFLIASAYLHDIGMRRDPTSSEISPDEIRAKHHLRSEEFIIGHFSKLGIEDKHQAEAIGRICRGHRKEDLSDEDIFSPELKYRTGHTISTPLLAAFLRLSDELDLTFERIPLGIYEISPPKNPISKEEWDKHVIVSGIDLGAEDQLKIIASASCSSPRLHWGLKLHERKINEENMRDLSKYLLYNYHDLNKELPRRFEIDISPNGYKPYDFKFTIEKREIINLLMGEMLYKRKEACLREILKNSIDACRARQESMEELNEEYMPKITFRSDEVGKLIIEDNGTGMDEDIIKNYFTKIGQSFYRSPKFLKNIHSFNPLSELGIGILSCFMIAHKIEIDTKAEDSMPLLLEINDVGEYFFVKDGIRRPQGTTIALHLKENAKGMKIISELKNYARHLDFPIYYADGQREITTIEKDNSLYQFEQDEQDFRRYWLPDEFKLPESKLMEGRDFRKLILGNNSNIDMTIYIFLDKGEFSFSPSAYRRMSRSPLDSNVAISIGGILINDFSELHKELFDNWTRLDNMLIDVNIKADIVDLDVSRNNFIINEKYQQFLNLLRESILELFSGFLTDEREKNEDDAQYKKTLQNFFQYYFGIHGERNHTEKFAYRFYPLECITKEGDQLYTMEEITDHGYEMMLNDLNILSIDLLKDWIKNCIDFDDNMICIKSGLHPSLLNGNKTHKLSEILKVIESEELKDYMPDNLGLAKLSDYQTEKFILLRKSCGETPQNIILLINIDNKFINLIIKNKNEIPTSMSNKIEEFFKLISKIYTRENRQITDVESGLLQSTQREILNVFIDKGVIMNIDEYIIQNYY